MNHFPNSTTPWQLPGPAGELELLTTTSKDAHRNATAIICHPHPLFGGTMNNKVVTILAKTFEQLGLRTVRFNFRGVGKSAGTYSAGKGEIEDVLAIINWVKQVNPHDDIWLAGFSFGAYVSIQAATKINPTRLISIAPPIENFPLPTSLNINCPWIIVQGETDEVVNPQAVFDWIEKLNPTPIVIRMKDTSHFFHGKLIELQNNLLQVLS